MAQSTSPVLRLLILTAIGAAMMAGLAWISPSLIVPIALAFGIQFLGFIVAYARQTETFFDLLGACTYLSVFAWLATEFGSGWHLREWLTWGLVLIWASRLGLFLWRRIHRSGGDGRFDEIKPVASRFAVVWVLQGLWVVFTTLCAMIMLTQPSQPFTAWTAVGLLTWGVGFGFEVVADHQKSAFRRGNPSLDRWISTGLWSRSRHPNYFGEIMLWTGVALMAIPSLSGWLWIGLVSPVFIIWLLTKVSGVPMLEARADERWGGDPEYEHYKATVPVLVPRLSPPPPRTS